MSVYPYPLLTRGRPDMPRSDQRAPGAAPAQPQAKKRTVLVVDDEKDIVDLITYNLQRNGYDVLCALDGTEAIELAQKHVPDLVVLDLMLPGIDGTEVARRLK